MLGAKSIGNQGQARAAAIRGREVLRAFSNFKELHAKNGSSGLPSFLKEGSCTDVTPTVFL